MPNGTVIVPCDCNHTGQDELHGVGRRVANYKGSTTKDSPKATCTVCGKESNCKPVKI